MRKSILIIIFAWVCIFSSGYHMASAQSSVDEISALAGTVTWTAQPGTTVKEGSDLVKISTMTGSITACRASSDGTVIQILVHPGESIKAGQVVGKLVMN